MDYAVAKAGMLAFTKALASADGPAIRVNAVAPGPVWTPFWTKEGGFADSLAALHKCRRRRPSGTRSACGTCRSGGSAQPRK